MSGPRWNLFVAIVVMWTLAVCAGAHNTNVTHTRITASAGRIVTAEDSGVQYAELRRSETEDVGGEQVVRHVFWGDDPEFNEVDAALDQGGTPPFMSFTRRTVTDGVVREDDPVGRVWSHFYNGYTGAPMPISSPFVQLATAYLEARGRMGTEYLASKTVAMRFFDMSVEVYGYLEADHEEPAKPFSYWIFGRSLHHLEDMNSVAHVSSDPHLSEEIIFGFPEPVERDDFEAHYVPTLIWNNDATVTARIDSPVPSVPIVSFDQVWSPPRNAAAGLETTGSTLFGPSLSRSVYNLATFRGTLEFPTNMPLFVGPNMPPVAGALTFDPTQQCPTAPSTATGTGELAQMFNDPAQPCGLVFDQFGITGYAAWQIDGIGKYLYQEAMGDLSAGSAWWSVRYYGGPCVDSQCGDEQFFYLEQLMEGYLYGDDFQQSLLVVPYGLREHFDRPWDPGNNPVLTDNTVPILQRYAEHVLPLGPAYAAGYAKWWYDIVNTPPYLKSVAVTQGGENRYRASWRDEIGEREIDLITTTPWAGDTFTFGYTKARFLEQHPGTPIPLFIDGRREIEITLVFNEPIEKPPEDATDDNGQFSLSLGPRTLTTDEYSVQTLGSDLDGNALDQDWNRDSAYLITIPADTVSELDGRIVLNVKARDKNNHWNAIGAELDDDPSTPARRQRRNAGQPREEFVEGSTGWTDFPWHDESSIDVNFPNMAAGDFAYTWGAGDDSHVLLFDSTPPEIDGQIDVQR